MSKTYFFGLGKIINEKKEKCILRLYLMRIIFQIIQHHLSTALLNSFSPMVILFPHFSGSWIKGQFLAKGTIQMHGEPKTTAILQFQNVADNSDFIQVLS